MVLCSSAVTQRPLGDLVAENIVDGTVRVRVDDEVVMDCEGDDVRRTTAKERVGRSRSVQFRSGHAALIRYEQLLCAVHY